MLSTQDYQGDGMATRPPRKPKQPKAYAITHSAKALGLTRGALPNSIVEVIGTLNRANFDGYIVGGGVRDSLLGLAPKDFDAVTDARPHEIKAIFGGRCRIIGRRFQLAHVYSGREMIEVATFRAPPKDDTHTTDDGMITRDNVWGTIEQDFARRDFSINALYYQPLKGEVLDFCGAMDDIAARRLRLLGDAQVRIEEDPVRLLRALRFRAKLGFSFDKALASTFHADNWALLEQVSAHRLYDESQKMFGGGYLAPLLPLLFSEGAIGSLMTYPPETPSRLMTAVAVNTDKRVAEGKGVNPAFFYAALLWGNYLHQLTKYKKRGLPFHEAQAKAAERALEAQRVKTAIPKFAEQFITEIWLMQPKLANPRVRDIAALERSPKFRAAYDFLVLREAHDDHPLSEPTNGMGAWWQTYQAVSQADKMALIDAYADGVSLPKGKRRSRNKDAASRELEQLRGLSLRTDVAQSAPKPLFVIGEDNSLSDSTGSHVDIDDDMLSQLSVQTAEQDKPVPRTRSTPPPVFSSVTYTDADFERLLANDEPYIPSSRHRKRKPSSRLSILERQAGITEADIAEALAAEDAFIHDNAGNVEGGGEQAAPIKRSRSKNRHERSDDAAAKPSAKPNMTSQADAAHPSDAPADKLNRRQRRSQATDTTAAQASDTADAEDAAPKKRRRRRKSNAKPQAADE